MIYIKILIKIIKCFNVNKRINVSVISWVDIENIILHDIRYIVNRVWQCCHRYWCIILYDGVAGDNVAMLIDQSATNFPAAFTLNR